MTTIDLAKILHECGRRPAEQGLTYSGKPTPFIEWDDAPEHVRAGRIGQAEELARMLPGVLALRRE